ncbi:MAG: hypothetical protein QMD92_05550 [bacterium]|nr:hypothetical protein [bacterium]
MSKIKKNLLIGILVLIFIFPNHIWAKENKENEDIKESKWRRFEILFSISLPFTSIISYLLVSSIDAAFSKGKMFSVRKKHHSSVLAISIALSSLIAIKGLKESSKPQEMEK